MKVFEKLSKMGIPCQWRRDILPGLNDRPENVIRWLRLEPVDGELWSETHQRMQDPGRFPDCERCPTHTLHLVSADESQSPRYIGDVCDECGTLHCGTDFSIDDGPWYRLDARAGKILWLPGQLIQHLDEFIAWFRHRPEPLYASGHPYR